MVARLGMPGAGRAERSGTGCGRWRRRLRRAARAAGSTRAVRPPAGEHHEVPGECGRGAGRRGGRFPRVPLAVELPVSSARKRVPPSVRPRPPAAPGTRRSQAARAPSGSPEAEPEAGCGGTEKLRFAQGCGLAVASRHRLGPGGLEELRIPVRTAAYFHDSACRKV